MIQKIFYFSIHDYKIPTMKNILYTKSLPPPTCRLWKINLLLVVKQRLLILKSYVQYL